MKNILLLIIIIINFSCDSIVNKEGAWTDEDKDFIFKQCISEEIDINNKSIEDANEFCYCAIQEITNKFINKEAAFEEVSRNPDIKSVWYNKC